MRFRMHLPSPLWGGPTAKLEQRERAGGRGGGRRDWTKRRRIDRSAPPPPRRLRSPRLDPPHKGEGRNKRRVTSDALCSPGGGGRIRRCREIAHRGEARQVLQRLEQLPRLR